MQRFLTELEAIYCQRLVAEFESDNYLSPLITTLQQNGITTSSMPFLFELRFAKALKDRGLTPEYECRTVGSTTVDFVFKSENQTTVFAELVSINVSDAVTEATQHQTDEDGIERSELMLSTDNEDYRFTEEGEVLLVQQKICEKVFRGQQAIKFHPPNQDGSLNIIVVDMRGFLGGDGGDNTDCVQLSLGNKLVKDFAKRYWTVDGQHQPILGLFQDTERPRGAPTLRKRIHGILFTNDKEYTDGSLMSKACLIHNPHLISNKDEHDRLHAAVHGVHSQT